MKKLLPYLPSELLLTPATAAYSVLIIILIFCSIVKGNPNFQVIFN